MPQLLICVALLACSTAKNNSAPESEAVVTDKAPAAIERPTVTAAPQESEPASSAQSFEEGMQLLCDSVDKVDANLSPSGRQRAVAKWIDENVKNSQVRELFSIIGDVPASKRAGMMKTAAAKAGITACAIAAR